MWAGLGLYQSAHAGGVFTRRLSVSGALSEPTVGTCAFWITLIPTSFHNIKSSFQRKAYANIEIVLTEKKGYGLRAASEISRYVHCIRIIQK